VEDLALSVKPDFSWSYFGVQIRYELAVITIVLLLGSHHFLLLLTFF
jgi:hypothetical protein